MTELVLYTEPRSRGRIARWMLEEVGAPYRAEIVPFGPAMHDGGFKAINPMAKVPALRHGEVIVTETPAICAYLADAFPEVGLAPPPGDPLRGAYYRWMFFAAGPIEAAMIDRAMGFEVPPKSEGMCGYGSYRRVHDVLESAIAAHPFILGDRFSAVDIYLGSQIGFGLMFKSLEARPAFAAYWGRVRNRPAAIRAREMDDALVAAAAAPAA